MNKINSINEVSKQTLEIINNIKEIRNKLSKTINLLKEINIDNYFIAGGYITHELYVKFHGESYYPQDSQIFNSKRDLDVFVYGPKTDTVMTGIKYGLQLKNILYEEKERYITFDSPFEKGLQIQIIKAKNFNNPIEILNTVDLSINLLGFTDSNVFFNYSGYGHIKTKEIDIANFGIPHRMMKRINKYCQRGFDFKNQTMFFYHLSLIMNKNPRFLKEIYMDHLGIKDSYELDKVKKIVDENKKYYKPKFFNQIYSENLVDNKNNNIDLDLEKANKERLVKLISEKLLNKINSSSGFRETADYLEDVYDYMQSLDREINDIFNCTDRNNMPF